MKKLLCIVLMILTILPCFGCNPVSYAGPAIGTSPTVDFRIYVVDGENLKEVFQPGAADMWAVMQLWLEQNGLDKQFALVGAEIIIPGSEPPTVTSFDYLFGNDLFHFNADFATFIESDENALFARAVRQTLFGAKDLMGQMLESQK